MFLAMKHLHMEELRELCEKMCTFSLISTFKTVMKDRTLSDVLKTRWKGDENYRYGVSDTIELLYSSQNIFFPVVFYEKDKLCPDRRKKAVMAVGSIR